MKIRSRHVLAVLAAATFAHATDILPTTNPAGTLRAGDVVEITVYDLTGPGKATPIDVRLDGQGRVKLPMIDEVEIAGMTNDAATAVIAKAYRKAQILSGPVVIAIDIKQTAAQITEMPRPAAVGDTVRVTVFDLTGPGSRFVCDAAVAADGTITVPIAGKVKIEGLTDGDAARAVAKAYVDKQVLSSPMTAVMRTTGLRFDVG